MTLPVRSAVALVGPTASGKSALAHDVALESAGEFEILSVDAMGVYRGMDLGTAKPTREEREEVSYHLLDLVTPSEEFTVAQFQRAARTSERRIASGGHGALYVGGTGLYGRAVLDDLDIPARYPEIRRTLEVRAANDLRALYEELVELDPLAASRLEATNERRVVRALEVTLGAKRPFSSYGEGLLSYGPVRVVQVGLDCELAVLDERVERRFRSWMEQGLLSEVAGLLRAPEGLGRPAPPPLARPWAIASYSVTSKTVNLSSSACSRPSPRVGDWLVARVAGFDAIRASSGSVTWRWPSVDFSRC